VARFLRPSEKGRDASRIDRAAPCNTAHSGIRLTHERPGSLRLHRPQECYFG